jgi:DNA-binding protein Fis
MQKWPTDDDHLHHQLIRTIERELLEQVLPLCDNVLVKAAARLGINRNTLHKKLAEFKSPLVTADEA